MVTAVVEPTGTLERLEVAESWRSRLTPTDIPGAIAQAAAAAEESYGEAASEALTQAFDAATQSPIPSSHLTWNPLGTDPSELFTPILAFNGGPPGAIAGAVLIAAAIATAISLLGALFSALIAYLNGIAAVSGALEDKLNAYPGRRGRSRSTQTSTRRCIPELPVARDAASG